MDKKSINIEAILHWDNNSIGMLYENFYQSLVGYSLHITANMTASEDIVQDLFSKIWEDKITFSTPAIIKSYLYNSVKNRSINYLRHNNIENNIFKQTLELEDFHISSNGEEDFFTEEIYRQLFLMIDKLPNRQREIFLLCMDGKKNQEIADTLNLSIETVRTHKKRAIKYLKEKLGPKSLILLSFFI
jgi:RNA polymerase sigma-70 factor (ECF subfamily)